MSFTGRMVVTEALVSKVIDPSLVMDCSVGASGQPARPLEL
jgi:hypothetical protein